MRITVGIVSYNTCALTCRCIESVMMAGAQNELLIVLADNGSTDGTAETVAALFPQVMVLSFPDNPGYGSALNQILTRFPSPFFLAMNADVVLERESLNILISFLSNHPMCALVGPSLKSPSGVSWHSCKHFPSGFSIFIDLFGLEAWYPFSRYIRYFYYDNARSMPAGMVDSVSGSVMLIHSGFFQRVDGFDAGFRLYFEEDDLCYRLGQLGYQVAYVPDSIATHIHAASTSQSLERQITYYLSCALYAHKHFSIISAFGVYAGIYLSRFLRIAALFIKYFPASPSRFRQLVSRWKACLTVMVQLTKCLLCSFKKRDAL